MKKIAQLYLLFICLSSLSYRLVAQCLPDRHTTTLTDGWLSCHASQPPDETLSPGHWIQYDLGSVRSLYDVHMWNISHPAYLLDGIKDVLVKSSLNGLTYSTMDTFTLPRADPSGFYQGQYISDWSGHEARYVLIYALNNHGGTCAGFAEIRIHTTDIQPDAFVLDFTPCENSGVHHKLSGGLAYNGTYTGAGVVDNGDDSFDFDPDLVGPGMTTIHYTYRQGGQDITLTRDIEVLACGDKRCPDCVLCGTNASLLNASNIPSGIYYDKEIHSMGQIQPTHDVQFRGDDAVIMHPGFEVNASSAFLAEIRACDDNLVSNYSFEDGFAGWDFWYNDSTYATRTITTTEVFEGAQAAQIHVVQSHQERWRVQFNSPSITLEQGKRYRIHFAMKSPDSQGLYLRVESDGSPWTGYFDKFVQSHDFWQNHQFEFTVTEPAPTPVRISFQMAQHPGVYYIDQVKLVEIDEL